MESYRDNMFPSAVSILLPNSRTRTLGALASAFLAWEKVSLLHTKVNRKILLIDSILGISAVTGTSSSLLQSSSRGKSVDDWLIGLLPESDNTYTNC